MPFSNKPLETITEADLQRLVDDEVFEKKTIEYKEYLSINTRDEKKEFLADVSSFANASGGYLFFGIKEKKGIAVEICGLQDINADKEKLRLENLLRDNLKPRVPSISIEPITVTTGTVIVIHIPRSWAQPHVVNFSKHWRFYSRHSAGKYPLDVSEVRTAFTLSESIADRIRDFRAERLSNIVAGEMPALLQDGAKTILHIIPINAFNPASKIDMISLADKTSDLSPIYATGWSARHNFDGYLTYNGGFNQSTYSSYLQVFNNGIIEAVDVQLLRHQINGEPVIRGIFYEGIILEKTRKYLQVQKQLGVLPPLFIMLSLLGVLGYTIQAHRPNPSTPDIYSIDKNDLIIPEIMIESFDCDLKEIMKPAFTTFWNAAGWPYSMSYMNSRYNL